MNSWDCAASAAVPNKNVRKHTQMHKGTNPTLIQTSADALTLIDAQIIEEFTVYAGVSSAPAEEHGNFFFIILHFSKHQFSCTHYYLGAFQYN